MNTLTESGISRLVFKDSPKVRAVFSLKNPEFNAHRPIPGLNLGYNTSEPDAITRENRRLWLRAAGADPERTSWGIQVHGTHIEEVEAPGVYPETDGLICSKPGHSIGIFVADCAAVLLCDEARGIIGAAHAGWKGAAAGIVPGILDRMIAAGARSEHIEAFISPCISEARFEVGEEVAAQFPEAFVNRSYPKPHVDLGGFIVGQLQEIGLKQAQISRAERCTMNDARRFYSFRREAGQSGRMMALITLK